MIVISYLLIIGIIALFIGMTWYSLVVLNEYNPPDKIHTKIFKSMDKLLKWMNKKNNKIDIIMYEFKSEFNLYSVTYRKRYYYDNKK